MEDVMSKIDQIISEQYAKDILNAYELNQKPDEISMQNLLTSTAHLIADGESYGPNLCRLQDYLNAQHTYTDRILNYLKKRQKTINEDEWIFSISGPDFVTSEDSIIELYWMRLVQDFGDYVVSPRYGWIDRDKLDDCINHIIEMINKTYG